MNDPLTNPVLEEDIRNIMQAGREWIMGDPHAKHDLGNGKFAEYEVVSFQASHPLIIKFVSLIANEQPPNRKLIWRRLPEISYSGLDNKYGACDGGGFGYAKLYMRYAFAEVV